MPYYRKVISTPVAGSPLLVLLDLFSVTELVRGGLIYSRKVISVFLRLSAAVTTADERILIQAKKAEGGSHTAAGGAVLTDSAKAWVVDALIGKRVYNVTDGSHATITDNDATTVTATLSGGTSDTWATGDEYMILDAEPRSLQSTPLEPWLVTDTEFMVILDECVVFSDEALEIEYANTDSITLIAGSNAVYE